MTTVFRDSLTRKEQIRLTDGAPFFPAPNVLPSPIYWLH
jgi:hypothetical protein